MNLQKMKVFKKIIDYMNFYEFIYCLVLTSYSNFESKLRCKFYKIIVLFMIFDFD